ncbi:MAG: hypothetical protein JWM87_1022 [Candidatus Eremiobacteraeota bacterium]|nr:hypothetical protein [Candidatus Eremiobacteraeota bacterium]
MAVALAAALAPLPAPAAPAPPAPPAGSEVAPNQYCNQALQYEKTAASDSVTRQASYDSAVAGLSANQRCNDAQMRLVNEAYLLSMRAAAAHELKIGNWQRDMDRANMLLTQCTNWPGLKGKLAGTNCATQRQYNQIMTKTITTVPSPRPASSGASPAAIPTPPVPGPARTAVPLPQPVSPNPSPSPRR